MKHINEIELTEYVAGKLTASRTEQVQEHIATCRQCSDRWLKAVELWNALGQWDVDTAGRNLTVKIMAKAEQQGQDSVKHDNIHKLWKGYLPDVLRVAASIIITVGIGHQLGKYSVTRSAPKAPVTQNRPEYLSALSLEWSSQLTWFVLEDDSPDMGAEQ
jgi:anti-sigma factor RsiW